MAVCTTLVACDDSGSGESGADGGTGGAVGDAGADQGSGDDGASGAEGGTGGEEGAAEGGEVGSDLACEAALDAVNETAVVLRGAPGSESNSTHASVTGTQQDALTCLGMNAYRPYTGENGDAVLVQFWTNDEGRDAFLGDGIGPWIDGVLSQGTAETWNVDRSFTSWGDAIHSAAPFAMIIEGQLTSHDAVKANHNTNFQAPLIAALQRDGYTDHLTLIDPDDPNHIFWLDLWANEAAMLNFYNASRPSIERYFVPGGAKFHARQIVSEWDWL